MITHLDQQAIERVRATLHRDVTVKQDGEMISLTKVCTVTNRPYSVRVPAEDYLRWKAENGYVQREFPYLGDDAREFLISATTPAEWDAMFDSEEDEDEDEEWTL